MTYQDAFKIIIPLTLTVIVIFLVWQLASVILLLITALMLAAALQPIVARLAKKLPLSLSAAIVILGLFLPIVGILVAVLPSLIRQAPDILNGVNNAFQNTEFFPDVIRNIDLSSYTNRVGEYVLSSTGKITNLFVTFLTLVVMTFYILIDSKNLKRLFLSIFPDSIEKKVETLLDEVARINGHYIRSNLFISLICGLVIFVGLLVLNVPYAGPLALFAAIMDLLPLVGAFIAAVPAVILAFTISPTAGILTLILFLVYQQIENYFIAPTVYNRALDISSGLSFLSVIIGATLLGIPGAFIALPIAASIPALLKYTRTRNS